MTELVSRLHSVRPIVERIRTTSCATGVSVGVIHGGNVVFTDNFGFRDVQNELPPDEDTIYYLASLSKSFTAAGIAHLISQTPNFTWDTPVSQLLPELSHKDEEIRDKASILDFLSHRTGLTPKNHIWSQEWGHFCLKRGEDIRTITDLDKIAKIGTKWIYNNWGYAVADQIIEHISGKSWGRFLQDNIFEPIGMERTVTKPPKDDQNVAKAYVALSSGEPWEIVAPDGEDGKIMDGALAVRSCVRDLLRYYIAFMKTVKADRNGVSRSAYDMPFVDTAKMVEPHIKLSTASEKLEGSYGLGWATVHLPSTLGAIGLNSSFVDEMPTVGRGMQKRVECLYHQGSANSFLTSVHLVPETESGVIVLTNTMAQNDVADWIGALYLETILDNADKNNYVKLAAISTKNALALWPGMRKELEDSRIRNTPVRPLSEYVGIYYNRLGNYHIEIFANDNKLLMRFQREKNIVYELTHYHYNTFSWLLTHDRNAKLGRFPITRASYYLIDFVSYRHNSPAIDSLIWIHDDENAVGEHFFKNGSPVGDEMILNSMFSEPVEERTSEVVAQIAVDIDGRVEVACDCSYEKREVVLVPTELEDHMEAIDDADAAVGGAQK